MISRSIHFGLSCDECGRGYGEIGDIENIAAVLKGTGWGVVGNKHFCDHCIEEGLKKEQKKNPEAEVLDLEENKNWGNLTKNGWINVKERMPEVGLSWVLGKTPDGQMGICRFSKELGYWVSDSSEIIKQGIDYWHYLPVFP